MQHDDWLVVQRAKRASRCGDGGRLLGFPRLTLSHHSLVMPLPTPSSLIHGFVLARGCTELAAPPPLSTLTLGEVDVYGAYTISGYSFSGLDIEFYGATHDREAAIAWRINRLGILQESDITETTLQLLDFAALRTDVLEHWAKQEAAEAKGGNS